MPLWPLNISPEPLITPVKRGQSRVTTLTESVYPTERPTSSYHHGQPTIAGSFGGMRVMSRHGMNSSTNLENLSIKGFLGLVIGLGVLAIASSIAAFILIRRRRRAKAAGGGFPKPGGGIGGLFGRKKNKGWMETHSYTDHNDDDIPLPPKGGQPGRVYDDPFNAESLDNLQRETSAQIDHGPEYQPVSTKGDADVRPSTSPTSLKSGTKFHEAI
ncbi:hypothetical protein M408DRAFT_8478 [Serendipita vermifera MAFF 305830]|uniref:Uncharacterized protein n=1 Tax=Serendipita vermifera MAFF 305830 TaxID=933852 RepID=A0A0C3BAJ9_SERVB|nr:hypothetical protein M408DRAFT_8478 [Serendipita vermifera MAFF 305830]